MSKWEVRDYTSIYEGNKLIAKLNDEDHTFGEIAYDIVEGHNSSPQPAPETSAAAGWQRWAESTHKPLKMAESDAEAIALGRMHAAEAELERVKQQRDRLQRAFDNEKWQTVNLVQQRDKIVAMCDTWGVPIELVQAVIAAAKEGK